MEHSFWNQLAAPIIGLSPMDGITDHPFRFIQKKYGQPAIVFTEFTSVEGMCHGAERLLKDFMYDESQRPIIGQIYGTTPDFFRQSAIVLCQLGFDGIDINMGCPAKNVAHSGAGAALIKNPELALKIVAAVKEGIHQWQQGVTAADCPDIKPSMATSIAALQQQLPTGYQQPRPVPVSIKTRIGYDAEVVNEWIPRLLSTTPAAISIHGRTLKQHYGGQANWEAIGVAAQLAKGSSTKILGNGDVRNASDARQKCATYGTDGALLGRATFGNPFVFEPTQVQPEKNIFKIALEHTQLYEQVFGQLDHYSFMPMRKHLGWYVKEVPNATDIRVAVFQTNTSEEVAAIFHKYGLLN